MFHKKDVFLLVLLPVFVFGISFTIENLDAYNADKPTVSVDTAGRVYLVANSSGGRDLIRYLTKLSGPWQQDSLIFSLENSINYNARATSANGPDGSLHIAYRVAGGTYGWPVYTNNSSGSFTDCDTLMKNASQSTFHYGIAVDNLNHAHIICEMYSGSYNLAYFYPFHPDSMLWLVANAIDPTIAVSKDNKVHIAYQSTSNTRIYYINNVSGAFGSPVLDSDSIGMDPSIAVDTAGFVHISWTRSNWDTLLNNLYYATNTTGVFQTQRVTYTPSLAEAYPSIALSRAGDVGIGYCRYRPAAGTNDIMFASKKVGEPLFTIDSLGPGHWNASFGAVNWNDRAVTIDRFDYVHFTYYGPNGTEYAKSQTLICAEELTRGDPFAGFSLRCYPNPCDQTATIMISYSVIHDPRPSKISIYDASGRSVIDLPLRSTVDGLRSTVIWDRRAATGAIVPCGVYIIQACLQSRNGNRITRSEKLIVIE